MPFDLKKELTLIRKLLFITHLTMLPVLHGGQTPVTLSPTPLQQHLQGINPDLEVPLLDALAEADSLPSYAGSFNGESEMRFIPRARGVSGECRCLVGVLTYAALGFIILYPIIYKALHS